MLFGMHVHFLHFANICDSPWAWAHTRQAHFPQLKRPNRCTSGAPSGRFLSANVHCLGTTPHCFGTDSLFRPNPID